MKNIIVVGDSFCSNSSGWPSTLAKELNLNLVCFGIGGQPWWSARNYLTKLNPSVIDSAEYIVFAHTNAERIPTSNEELGRIDHSRAPVTELEQAIRLYFKHIQDPDFIAWTHEQWFIEIGRTWGHKKLCHLHCFPWTVKSGNLLTGINVTTNLTALSLNELGATEFKLVNDQRVNHLNAHNNQELGLQLAKQLIDYNNRSVELDVGRFDQKTTLWLDRGTRW